MSEEKKNLEPEIEPESEDEEASLPEADDALLDLAAPGAAGALAAGRAAILRYGKLAPGAPGVYRMIDAAGDVLYVGKAKNIKKRILAYARPTGHMPRIERMISATATIEFVSTATETEALLLEANLIKRLRPRFNVTLRDDKSFPYILITGGHTAPQILKHRGARTHPGDYFGPFASAGAVNRTITALQRAFLIRSCSDAVYDSRTRPCLLHQIKRCSAPCTGEIAPTDYAELVREARAFLSGRSHAVKQLLAREMDAASAALDFERAAVYRDRLAALSAVQTQQGINPATFEEADVFAAHQDSGFTCIEVFFFRTGQNWGNRAYFPKADRSLSAADVLGSFLAQFYDDKPVPRLVLLSHDIPECQLLAEALSIKSGRKVEIAVPQRGEKKELIEHARANAREALGRKLAETTSQQKLLAALADALALAKVPQRIEVYDNSHIQGANAVGAMIVAGPEGFRKNQYRKFNIRSAELTPGDDFAMMREVLTRRFKRLIAEAPREGGEVVPAPPLAGALHMSSRPSEQSEREPGPSNHRVSQGVLDSGSRAARSAGMTSVGYGRPLLSGPPSPPLPLKGGGSAAEHAERVTDREEDRDDSPWPDLVLIDGGQGQLTAAQETLASLGITDMPMAAIAKGPDRDAGRETFFVAGRTPFKLPPRSPVLYFLQRLRDEAHRFAVGSHRQRRKRGLREGGLQEIPGIGPTRKRALLQHFGTLKAIERASVADLAQVTGVNAETARKIYDFFHERPA